MDLNIDFKNLKIEDIKEKLLKSADKKTLIKIDSIFTQNFR